MSGTGFSHWFTNEYLPQNNEYDAIADIGVVGCGSSMAYGFGATSPDLGCLNLLLSYLETKGIRTENKSVSGNNTSDVIARFDTDIVPLAAQGFNYFILALGLGNEGLALATSEAAAIDIKDNFVANVQTICGMAEAIGMEPILCGSYPNDNYYSVGYEYRYAVNKQAIQELSALGYPFIELNGNVDKGNGGWITSCRYDSSHANTQGHWNMYSGVARDLIRYIANGWTRPTFSSSPSILYQATPDTELNIISYTNPAHTIESFTALMDVTLNTEEVSRSFMGFEGDLRVINPTPGYFVLRRSGMTDVVTSVDPRDNLKHRIGVTYSHSRTKVGLIVDGTLTLSSTNITLTPASFRASFGARADGYSNASNINVGNLRLYRHFFTDTQAARDNQGYIVSDNLELFGKSLNAQGSITNLAPSDAQFSINTTHLTAA